MKLLLYALCGVYLVTILIYLYWKERPYLRRLRQTQQHVQVIGLGLSRTGTASLAAALRTLGWTPCHFPLDFLQRRAAYCAKYDALVDWALVGLRPAQLAHLFPGAIFVLTEREARGWIRSMAKLRSMLLATKIFFASDLLKRFDQVYGSQWLAFYTQWNTEALLLNPVRLNICGGDGWVKLCAALKCPVPRVPFPQIREIRVQLQQTFGKI